MSNVVTPFCLLRGATNDAANVRCLSYASKCPRYSRIEENLHGGFFDGVRLRCHFRLVEPVAPARTAVGCHAESRGESDRDLLRIDRDERCDTGDPTIDLCAVSFDDEDSRSSSPSSSSSLNSDDDIAVIVETDRQKSAITEAYDRGKWLIGLLVLQSSSSFVLDSYQDLIREHLVVTLFLTMLVGAGGNAGNQSAIKVIRGMAMGSISSSMQSLVTVLRQQVAVALILGTSLSAAGWFRVYITNGDVINASAIALSLFLIVCTSVIVGTLLPFGLARAGQDPANAGTSIQVLMDVLGVLITCTCCHYVLDEFASSTL